MTWLPVDPGRGDRVCNFGDDFERARVVAEKYDYLSSNGIRNLCQKPCSAMVVFLGMPFPADYKNANESYVKVRLCTIQARQARIVEEEQEYTTWLG